MCYIGNRATEPNYSSELHLVTPHRLQHRMLRLVRCNKGQVKARWFRRKVIDEQGLLAAMGCFCQRDRR